MFLFKLCCKDAPQTPQENKKTIIRSTLSIESANSSKENVHSPPKKTSIKTNKYEGQQLNGNPHGTGSMYYANGDYYRGEWVQGVKEGRGLQIYQQFGIKYQGEWQKNQPYGIGKLTNPDESFYIGEFKEGLKNGKGEFNDVVNGKIYQENYLNGELKQKVEILVQKNKEQSFPTELLDKERFNTKDLDNFQQSNPQIKELDLTFLLKYYNLCKVIKLQFIDKHMKTWTIAEVLEFVKAVNLIKYQKEFYKNKIKGKDLITLTEREMKEDLNLKLGDRKRLASYIQFLSQVYNGERSPERAVSSKNLKRGQKYKLKSIQSMKKVLKMIKSSQNPIYEQSIEELNQSHEDQERDRVQLNTTSKINLQKEFITQDIQYNTDTNPIHSLHNQNTSSFQKQASPVKSQRSSSSKSKKSNNNKSSQYAIRQPKRKRSDDSQNLNGLTSMQKDKPLDIYLHHRMSEDQNRIQPLKTKSCSSQSSSTESQVQLARKKTNPGSRDHTEIRELLEFLKEHRSLQFLIKEKDIQVLEQIGQGGYGKVYKAKYNGSLIAVKDFMKTGKHRNRSDFMKEVQVMSDLKHPNIVLYMGMCITANKYILITQFLQNGSLFDQLHKKKKQFQPHQQIQIVNDVVKGMVYLHNMKNIIHRDLKSSNVLIGEDWKVKLCDFGLSGQRKKSKNKKKNRIGTYQWMAPEVIRNEQIDFFSDVYSFGVLIWQILMEKIPYEGLTEQQIKGTVGYDQEHRLEEPEGPPFLVNIMKKCLMRKPSQRPSFMEIQSEFNSYLENLESKEKDS